MTAVDPRSAFDVAGRVAVVTGGGRGLGRAMTTGLAAAGASVVAFGRTPGDLDDTVAEVRAAGGQAVAVAGDIADEQGCARAVEAAVREFGALDIVINNAVDPGFSMVADITPELFDRVFAVNVRGPVQLCNAALPHLERSEHAAIVNVLSVALWVGGPMMGLYRATKEALWGFTKVMSKEWAERGIRVNGLAPGPFETSADTRRGREDRVRDSTLFKRIAASEEIVPPVLYLVSDASRFMTGAIVTIDGGVTP